MSAVFDTPTGKIHVESGAFERSTQEYRLLVNLIDVAVAVSISQNLRERLGIVVEEHKSIGDVLRAVLEEHDHRIMLVLDDIPDWAVEAIRLKCNH